MADKEERILIARSTDYTITDTDEGALFDGKIAPHCANVMTREQAIEKIAKALFLKTNKGDNWVDYKKTYPKNGYIDDAEVALNALLEDK